MSKKGNYPYVDENNYTWYDEGFYTDEVGGTHDCGIGTNPKGRWCGECSSSSCNGCVFEHDSPINLDN